MIDFHTHILPDIDDGAGSVEESVRMIEILNGQGVDKIVLTPHFYAYVSSAQSFIDKRNTSVRSLTSALKEKNMKVDLYLAGEILFFEELWRLDELKSFCISGTPYMVVELPFSSWDNSLVENVIKLSNRGVVPIIAHFERYIKYKGNMGKIRNMLNSGVLLQMNCNFINNFFTRRKAVRFIKKGMVSVLGTDSHNIYERCPEFEKAVLFLKKKLGQRAYERFLKKQQYFLKTANKVVY